MMREFISLDTHSSRARLLVSWQSVSARISSERILLHASLITLYILCEFFQVFYRCVRLSFHMSRCEYHPQRRMMTFVKLRCLSHPADRPQRRGRGLVKLVIPAGYLFPRSSVLFPLHILSQLLPFHGGSSQPIVLGFLGFSVSSCCQAGAYARHDHMR